MRLLFAAAVVLAGAVAGTAVYAQPVRSDMTRVCGEEAQKQHLRGQPLADFLTRCWAGQQPVATMNCDDEARRQSLSGEDLSAFLKKCRAGETPHMPVSDTARQACENRAKTLSGEAKSAFMRDCLAAR
ncbi:hypothetical protein [Vineibacter terrae]|uniref:hypothetical protein n=1 Tax=Vineibacter terrae TaxID=2586908 RepID=UPI002E330E83|nr:hypothetical protein [Vineibacter terrae]HEX2887438.1 hypothetical protein [Vineibacter terrae]